jgi:DHA3 family tetracycline resistance protein-like MFS transporter
LNRKPNAYAVYLIMRGWAALIHYGWLTVMLLYHTTMITNDPLQLAFIGVVLEGTTFLFEIPTGVFADTFGRRSSVIIAFLLIAIAMLVEGTYPIYAAILLTQFLWGLGFTFYSGAADAWIADEIGVEPARHAYMRGTQVTQLMALVGTGLAVLLGSIQLNLPIVMGGLALLGLVIFLIVFMPEIGFQPAGRHEHSIVTEMTTTFHRSIDLVRIRPALSSILIVGVVTGLSVGGYDRLYTPFILQNFTLPLFQPVVWFGILSAVTLGLTIGVVEIVRRRFARSPQTVEMLALLYGGTIVGNLGFVLAPNLLLALIAFWVSQSLRSATRPLIVMWINQHASSDVRATAISMYWQTNALGQIFGAPIVGLIGSLTTLRAALITASLALFPTLAVFQRSIRREKLEV